jgi:hypothetical protein
MVWGGVAWGGVGWGALVLILGMQAFTLLLLAVVCAVIKGGVVLCCQADCTGCLTAVSA